MELKAAHGVPISGKVSDDLVRRSQRGDQEAFAELVGGEQIGLYNVGLRCLGNSDDARDMVQESLLRAWVGVPGLKDPATFRPWLFRIMVNQCRNRARTQRRNPVTNLDDNVVVLGAGDPEEAVIAGAQHERLVSSVLGLSSDLRIALLLRDIAGLSYAEMAEALEVPLGTVRSRINRGRAELRRRLEADFTAGAIGIGSL